MVGCPRPEPPSGGAGSSPQEPTPAARALVVPGANFASQLWGLTRDEPLQPLARSPWAVRDAIPLVPPNTIRAMDAVEQLVADGRPAEGLAATLAGQGIRFVVVRNDLNLAVSDAASPLLVHPTMLGLPGCGGWHSLARRPGRGWDTRRRILPSRCRFSCGMCHAPPIRLSKF
ncbi:MAG: alpha-(1-_3)-arabinofuranosyltransferase family protein [Lawsonella clevelandensis]